MILTTRPLTDRSWVGAAPRSASLFTATWSDTLGLLEREVYALQTRSMPDPVLMMDITEADLRLDGQVRANARPASDAVALSFESKNGPLLFRCDRYNAVPLGGKNKMALWQHNVRAIALTLKALRAVDRYGATQQAEQYAGWRQIAAADAPMSVTEARSALFALLDRAGLPCASGTSNRLLVRYARRFAHPDTPTGSRAEWDLVEQAARVLGVE